MRRKFLNCRSIVMNGRQQKSDHANIRNRQSVQENTSLQAHLIVGFSADAIMDDEEGENENE